MKNFNILGVDQKIWLYGGSSRKTNIEGGLPKNGRLGHYADFREGLGKKEGGGVFEGGLIP